MNNDRKVIEADEVVFKAPFVPEDISLSNDSAQHGLKFTSNVKVEDGFVLTLGVWKISHDADKLYFYKNDDLEMKLE